MRRAVGILVAVAAGVVASIVLYVPMAQSQFTGGGGQVEVSNTVATDTRIVGQSVDVSIVGTVALDSASLETLNEPNCPPQSMGHMGVDGTVTLIPPTAASTRTKLLVVSHANVGYLSCRTGPASGFTSPVCTIPAAGVTDEGALLYPGGSVTLDITASTLLRCLNCTAGGVPSGSTEQVSFLEPTCT